MDPYCWSPDGNFVAFGRISPATGYDIWTMPMRGDDHTPSPFLNSPANEKYGDIAPDGKWLAYESNESGRFEIFVQSFPRAGTKYQVTSTGGRGPRWSRDGRELFYNASSGALLSVLVDGSQGLRFGTPVPPVKRGPPSNALDTPAGPRFLSIRVLGSGDRRTLTVMQNWTAVTHQGR